MKLEKVRIEKSPKKGKKPDFHRKEPVVSRWAKRLAVTALLGTAALFSKNVDADKKKDKTEQVDTKDAHQGLVSIEELPSAYYLSDAFVILQIGSDHGCYECEANKNELNLLYNIGQGYVGVYTLDAESELAKVLSKDYNLSGAIPATLYFKNGEIVEIFTSEKSFEVHAAACKKHFGIDLGSDEAIRNYLEAQLYTNNDETFVDVLREIAMRNMEVDIELIKNHLDSKNLNVRFVILWYISVNNEQILNLEKDDLDKFISFAADTFILPVPTDDYDWVYEYHLSLNFSAARALASLGVPALDYLISMLDDTDISVKEQSLATLYLITVSSLYKSPLEENNAHEITIYEEKLISAFKKALDDPNPETRSAAVYALGLFDPNHHELIVPSLLGALKDEDESIRKMAAGSLVGFINVDYAAKNTITELIENGNAEVRETIAGSFLCVDESSNLDLSLLEKLLEDDNWKVRLAAVESLMWYEMPKSLTLLAKAIDDENHEVRLQAVESIYTIYEELLPAYKQKAKFYLMKAAEDKNKDVSDRAKKILEIYEDDGIEAIPKNFI